MAMTLRGNDQLGKIGILMGGPSSERQISLKSGKAVYAALKDAGINCVAIDIQTDSEEENIRLIGSYKIDCAFVALHGEFGEDGRIQAILDNIGIPYTGSGARASSLAMDKIESRIIFSQNGLKVPAWQVLDKARFKPQGGFKAKFNFPLVVKPSSQGSSIGLSIVQDMQGLNKGIEIAFGFDRRIIIEEYIEGRELTVGIMEERALPVIEIVPKNKFFDYEAKYISGMTEYIVPAELEKDIAVSVQKAALEAQRLLGCSGCCRVDIILSKNNVPFVLEVNTIPGLTSTSLLPKAAQAVGIGFTELCLRLIRLAYEKRHSEISR